MQSQFWMLDRDAALIIVERISELARAALTTDEMDFLTAVKMEMGRPVPERRCRKQANFGFLAGTLLYSFPGDRASRFLREIEVSFRCVERVNTAGREPQPQLS